MNDKWMTEDMSSAEIRAKEMDRRIRNCFLDGLCRGLAFTAVIVIMTLLLIGAMFFSPEEKTRMICEPCAIVMAENGGI